MVIIYDVYQHKNKTKRKYTMIPLKEARYLLWDKPCVVLIETYNINRKIQKYLQLKYVTVVEFHQYGLKWYCEYKKIINYHKYIITDNGI